MTLEEKLKLLQRDLTVVNEERETLLASLKALRKDSQKADSALRSEIEILKRSSERHALAETRGRQKVLALQEAVKRAQNATKEIEEKVKEVEAEVPGLNKAKEEKEQEYATLKKEAEKVRKERGALEEKEKKRQEAMKAELAGLAVKLEKLGAKKEKLEIGIVPELERKLKEIEKEIEVEEQNLLKSEREENERYQQYQLRRQQRQRQQRGYHTHNLSEDHPPTSSVPIQRPRHHSSEFPTPIGRPTPAPIQRPTASNLTSSGLGYSVAGSTIWTQHSTKPQSQLHSHHPQASQRPSLPLTQQTQPSFSSQLHQSHNPRSLSFHNYMAPSASNMIRRSSLKNPISPPFSTTNHQSINATSTTTTTTAAASGSSCSNTPGSSRSSSKSVSSSPIRSSASIVASTSTLSSKAPVFEPTRSMSLISGLTFIKNSNTTTATTTNVTLNNSNNSNTNQTSPLLAKGKPVVSRASTIHLPAPIQRPGRVSSGDDDRNANGNEESQMMQVHRWSSSHGGHEGGGR